MGLTYDLSLVHLLTQLTICFVPSGFCLIYMLIVIGQLKPFQSVLIHAGSGGVGQAAINIAHHYECTIFTTVGSEEKREFIRKQFPQIPAIHIGNSRDTSFEQMVLKETDNIGVDIILNSLAEEKLQASVRCLAPRGKFLEIGKFDLENNNRLDSLLFSEGRSFHGIMLDTFFDKTHLQSPTFCTFLREGIENGYVRPLSRTIFKYHEVEQAFRYMAAGKHIGKVLVNIRQEESSITVVPERKLFSAAQRFYCNPSHCYVIVGGLGGFGLELSDWLVRRGARKLVLVSKRGLKTGYQAARIRLWKSYGAATYVYTNDVTTKVGCNAMISEAKKMGPIEGIFNLAVVLSDSFLENQDKQKYTTTFVPKATITKYLDKVTRKLCPELLYFVVFSSVACGRGNLGQTNYGMANSIMERICEKRKMDGYPALAIQWGTVADVGLVAEMQEIQGEAVIAGTIPQRITSCLEIMETFLLQNETVVSSMVVAEKRTELTRSRNVIEVVMNILGIKELKSVSLHASLSQLGMDSITAVEIRQALEREYEEHFTTQDVQKMTLGRIQQMTNDRGAHDKIPIPNGNDTDAIHMFIPPQFQSSIYK